MSEAREDSGAAPAPQPPGPGRERIRTPLIVAVGLLLIAAAIGVVVARVGGDDGDDDGDADRSSGADAPPAVSEPGDGPTTTNASDDTTTTTAAPEPIDGLAVVESGFSTYQGFDGPAGSYGLILENTTGQPITFFAVQVVVYDTNDVVVGTYHHDVAVVNPGARLGLGAEIGDPLPGGIGRLDIRTAKGEGGPAPRGAFTVADVSTSSDEFGVYTTFVVSSSYEVELELPHAYAVYRDPAGRIVGGANGLIDLIPPRGRVNGEVTAFDVVPNVARADVYVDAGFL
jgi:hypothetical protein